MLEWKSIAGKTGYYIVGDTLVPTYHISDHEIILIDSGSAYSKDFIDTLEKSDLSVAAIINTHLHVDHTGNNHALWDIYHMDIYAGREEVDIYRSYEKVKEAWSDFDINHTNLIYEQANCPMIPIERNQKEVIIHGIKFQIEDLSGHSEHHLAITTPDHVCCLGDVILSDMLIRTTKLPFMTNMKMAIDSIYKVKEIHQQYYALSHCCIIEENDISALIERNIEKFEKLCQLCADIHYQADSERSWIHQVEDVLNLRSPKKERQLFYDQMTGYMLRSIKTTF